MAHRLILEPENMEKTNWKHKVCLFCIKMFATVSIDTIKPLFYRLSLRNINFIFKQVLLTRGVSLTSKILNQQHQLRSLCNREVFQQFIQVTKCFRVSESESKQYSSNP